MRQLRIAIDGPAGAGKSTIAREIARRLGILYVDTGAMYRAVAWLAVSRQKDVADAAVLDSLLQSHSLQFSQNDEGVLEIFADGLRITPYLREPEISDYVSQLSTHASVRNKLTEWQREFSRQQSVVMDGRDIGTVVLPDAQWKFFVTADPEERVRRRQQEMLTQGLAVHLPALRQSLMERDDRDASRELAPLRRAADAIEIDTTDQSVDAVVDLMLSIIEHSG